MENLELYTERDNLVRSMHTALKECAIRGTHLSKAEHDYKVALAKFVLTERAKGTPATLIKDIALGDEEVAGLRLKRDIAKSAYDTAKDAVNVYKLNVRLVENQIEREWGLAKDE